MGKQICVAVLAIAGIGAPVRGQMSAPSMVAAIPNVSTQSPANSAGVLEYCVRHQLVSSVSASAILEKLNVSDRTQAAIYAVRNGLVESAPA